MRRLLTKQEMEGADANADDPDAVSCMEAPVHKVENASTWGKTAVSDPMDIILGDVAANQWGVYIEGQVFGSKGEANTKVLGFRGENIIASKRPPLRRLFTTVKNASKKQSKKKKLLAASYQYCL